MKIRNIVPPFVITCALSACQDNAPLTLTPLAQALPTGFIILPIADSAMRPGSIIEVKPIPGAPAQVRWLADIRSCGLKDDDLGFLQGNTGQLSSSKQFSLDANVAVQILAIKSEFKPQLQAAKSAVLKTDNTGLDRIDLIKTSSWFSLPGNISAMPPVCKTYLMQPNTYLVNEAFRVSSGSYTFTNSAGAGINLTALQGQNFSAAANVKITSDGSITVTSPEYIAVRDVKQVSLGTFQTMGTAGTANIPSADATLSGPIQVLPSP